jgi:deazaflavin-dependent oxidoreductase (nitroreductase family)
MTPVEHVLAWCSGTIPRFTANAHLAVHRATRGHIGNRVPGYRVGFLTTVGRRTGQRRTSPVLHFEDGGRTILIASNNGADVHPAWYGNLVAHPTAEISIDRRVVPVRAEAIEDGPERDRLWAVAMATYPLYRVVSARTTRRIPLVRLIPVEEPAAAVAPWAPVRAEGRQ